MSKQKYPQTHSSTGKATVGRRIKTEGYCSETLKAKRNSRRIEAEARQAECDARPIEARIELCSRRRGQSKREWARLVGKAAKA